MSKFIVVRDYSGVTAKNTLWKVLSRPFTSKQDAINWMEWMKTEEGHGKTFRIVKEENVYENQEENCERCGQPVHNCSSEIDEDGKCPCCEARLREAAETGHCNNKCRRTDNL